MVRGVLLSVVLLGFLLGCSAKTATQPVSAAPADVQQQCHQAVLSGLRDSGVRWLAETDKAPDQSHAELTGRLVFGSDGSAAAWYCNAVVSGSGWKITAAGTSSG